MGTLSDMDIRLVGTAELLDLLKVGRTRLHTLTSRPDFPRPFVTLRMGSIWDLAQVLAWAEADGRTVHLETLDGAATPATTDVESSENS